MTDWPREWRTQYLCEPLPPLPPGTYCRNCAHQELPYEDRLVPRRRGEPVQCCPRRDCGCTAHMVETFKIRVVIRFRYDSDQPFLKIAYARGTCLCSKRGQWECNRALSVLDLVQARDVGHLRQFWSGVRRHFLRVVADHVATFCVEHGGGGR